MPLHWTGMLEPDFRARTRFRALFGREARVAWAPGRVNLIGEHTDYNAGFVLPMALERGVVVAFAPRFDRRLRVLAAAFDTFAETALEGLQPPGDRGFLSYVAGVAWAMVEVGLDVAGLDIVVDGDLPIGAGLASSAALEVAAARAFCAASGFDWDPARFARLGQRAENAYVGVACGIMDQYAAAASRAGSALLIDCRSLETRPVPLPEAATILVMDSGLRRGLAGSAYNERRAACDRAVALLRSSDPRIGTLRDASAAMLEAARTRIDPTDFRRASHVVAETRRPVRFEEALARGDLTEAGRLMDASHASLRDLYEVSCEELDALVAAARSHPACFGARMTGAGFGGCAVALVAADEAADVAEAARDGYRRRAGREATVFACRPAGGARLVE
jgi:galactokinase